MIIDEKAAKVSNGPAGCTFHHTSYPVSIGTTQFHIYDTVGLNEGDQGRVPHRKAVSQLYALIRSLNRVSLLVYCMRGRIKENSQANWVLFYNVLCAKKVPIIAVETGVEHEEDLDAKRKESMQVLKSYGMVPKDFACIVSLQGRQMEHFERYKSSQFQLRQLILDSYKKEPWSTTTDDWICHIYNTTYTKKLCAFPEVKVEFARKVGGVVDEFIKESGMKEEESGKLKSALLDAEKRFLSRGFKFFGQG